MTITKPQAMDLFYNDNKGKVDDLVVLSRTQTNDTMLNAYDRHLARMFKNYCSSLDEMGFNLTFKF